MCMCARIYTFHICKGSRGRERERGMEIAQFCYVRIASFFVRLSVSFGFFKSYTYARTLFSSGRREETQAPTGIFFSSHTSLAVLKDESNVYSMHVRNLCILLH